MHQQRLLNEELILNSGSATSFHEKSLTKESYHHPQLNATNCLSFARRLTARDSPSLAGVIDGSRDKPRALCKPFVPGAICRTDLQTADRRS
ncbi:hypothetical protein EVAR_102508_1 [Eumeta japonica]|uniref:Uncharacterized protein n=1 Tax=Eumeta variegata TaxID=151549 RepID=A0A4C1ZQU2_EUMVA|nr:hypothetical protein EVAR_102508_1 [Eumeta japonica]